MASSKKITQSTNINKSKKRSTWSSGLGYMISAAGSAVGLGNFWRFPYLAAKYGGATFLFVHAVMIFTIGASLLLLENAIGRFTQKSVIEAFGYAGKKFKIVGIIAAAVPFLILPYYVIIGGWVTRYVYVFACVDTSTISNSSDFFNSFLSGNWTYFWAFVFLAVTFIIVALGVEKGIEKVNLVMMPALLIFGIGIAVYIMFQPGAIEGLKFYLVPDFSSFSFELILSALSQAFFTLSLAMGIMITYGSYCKKKENLETSALQVSASTFIVSFLAGLIILPAAFMSFNGPPTNAGATLMFATLPDIFNSMGAVARPIGCLFFILILFAALTSSISILETCVSIVTDTFNISRKKTIIFMLVFFTAGATFVNSGFNVFSDIKILDRDFLDFFDYFTSNLLMPIIAILTCIIWTWVISPKILVDEIKLSSKFSVSKIWVFIVRYIAPIGILLVFLGNLL